MREDFTSEKKEETKQNKNMELSDLGILLLTTAPFAEITSWICALNPSFRNERRVHSGVGCLQPRIPFPLHQPLDQDLPSAPPRQPRVGNSKVRKIRSFTKSALDRTS
ncbi:hypothetical protein Ae201684P_002166 [Aphanomyces euteiches]|uniref:Uncharacterized protein n=1 Tax=Aphanomyces euteiches TaxID=100861 RepID=A0A6G0XL40_9STRA|nr:hypothetical protein Ae201684_003704 [Aphanomyces euteiches]KAH9084934.1 hypothetical protein Ae201684P_002166 [Aphanomyces euteiches]